MRKAILTTVAVGALAILSGEVRAALITGDVADANTQDWDLDGVAETAPKDFTSVSNEVGYRAAGPGPGGQVRAFVVPFLLPTIASGDKVSTATLTLRHSSTTGPPTFNVDLYGLDRFNASPTLTLADHYVGLLDGSNTLLDDNFRIPTDAAGSFVSFSGASLVGWLNDQYTGGAGGSYVFARLSPDSATLLDGVNQRYRFNTANHGTASYRPTLDITVVPEPSMLVLWLSGLVGFMVFARYRRK